MADVSSRLRAARERAGLTIEDISARTKIKVPQLQAIERGEFDRLPGEFFTRAFLRTYAREVGLRSEDVTREYDAGRAPEPAGDVAPVAVAPAAIAAALRRRELEADASSSGVLNVLAAAKAWPVVAFAVVLLLLLAMLNRESDPTTEGGAVNAQGTVAAPVAPVATTGQPPRAAAEKLSMHIEPTAEIWINATVDGKRAIYRLVKPGERLTLEARQQMAFRIGNAAAFQYSINGVPGRVLGGSGEVLEFQITRNNVQTYQR